MLSGSNCIGCLRVLSPSLDGLQGLLTVFEAGATLISNCSYESGFSINAHSGSMKLISVFLQGSSNHSLRISFLVFLLALSACAGVPVQEMSNARQAVEAARKVGADTRASKELKSAETLLQSAEQALQEGDYKQARKDAEASRDQAVQAQDKSLNE